jgi:hypothetical protein
MEGPWLIFSRDCNTALMIFLKSEDFLWVQCERCRNMFLLLKWFIQNTGRFKKSFTTLKAYTNLYRGTCLWQPKSERVLRPQHRKIVWPLLHHGDSHYGYRVSGHAPTERRRWPSRTQSLPARRHPLPIILHKCTSTSAPVSQVDGLVERRR